MAKLTVVDFSNKDRFKPGTSSWFSIRKDKSHVLEELGCFVAKLPDIIPSEIRSPLFGTLDELSDFATETKLQRFSLTILHYHVHIALVLLKVRTITNLREEKNLAASFHGESCKYMHLWSLTIEPSTPIHTMAKLTVVDFSDKDCFKSGTSSWLSIRKDICHALEELGCFVAKLADIIPSESRSAFFGTLDELFDFPTKTKQQITYEKPFPIGYIPYSAATE
ncbi:inactive 2-oxoglutarate-dependent dioxygenase AOP2 [Pyrus ussuriensis x Pyrus communis]|uniref:Inactive 2-oxoglutarate-dependent dioxygenase AOP2 n=1 Tax=Pyrus ussuriensis x Pyrus communis TaxID=2448454 RepID=A0A5N5HGL6_9ROSA|nr:inactive 2-oxoglutarate-dependent dioxygenase AOP2 [Pyrus ussuriensis x Pyrus communis]